MEYIQLLKKEIKRLTKENKKLQRTNEYYKEQLEEKKYMLEIINEYNPNLIESLIIINKMEGDN